MIEGENAGRVPCFELPAPLPVDPVGAIVGSNVGRVHRNLVAAPVPDDPSGAIVGSNVGFVPGICTVAIAVGFQFIDPIITESGLIIGSTDGINWSPQNAHYRPTDLEENTGVAFNAVAWSPELGLFVIGGSNSFDGAGHEAPLATSPDGVNWTHRDSGFGAWASVGDAVWAPGLGLFLIIGSGGVDEASNVALASTSPDGITWSVPTAIGTNVNAICAAWSEELGLFVIGGVIEDPYPWTAYVATSPNGVTWTQHETHFGDGFDETDRGVHCVAWSPELGLFVIGGYCIDDNLFIPPFLWARLATSPDGSNWTVRDSGIEATADESLLISAVAWSSELGKFVIGTWWTNTRSRAKIASSTDGINWGDEGYLLNFFGTGVQSIAWSRDLEMFIVGGNFRQLWTSVDGYFFEERNTGIFFPIITESLRAIAISESPD